MSNKVGETQKERGREIEISSIRDKEGEKQKER